MFELNITNYRSYVYPLRFFNIEAGIMADLAKIMIKDCTYDVSVNLISNCF